MTRAAIACLFIAGSAAAHEAPTGWTYDENCCSGHDCAHIEAHTVEHVPGGWKITLSPEDHPMVQSDRTYFVPFDDRKIRASQDEFFHACLGRHSNMMFCLYVPEGGF